MSQEIVVANLTTIAQPVLAQQTQSSFFSYPVITIIVAIICMVIAVKMGKSKKKPKNVIAIIGQRYSGKTQLFISLNQGKKLQTVPSIQNNQTTIKLHNKPYKIIDYIGDNISKQQILTTLPQIHTIIHVIDGTDTKLISDAAMFLYKVLVSKQYQKDNCNYVIFLNKNDCVGYAGKVKIQQKLEDQVEHVKQSRINQGEDNENQDDYIKLAKNRFKLPFKIVQGSAENDIKDLQMTIQNL